MKKFIAMLLALAMVLSLAACGSKTDAPAETKAQTAAEKPLPRLKRLKRLLPLLSL